MRGTLRVLTAAGVVAALSSGCASRASSVSVPMMWRPTSQMKMNAFAGDMPATKVYIAPVADKRARKGQVGVNLERTTPKPVYAGSEPTEFVRNATLNLFQRAGLQVVSEEASAERIVTAELNQFWTQETGTYESDVRATYYVKDRAGKQLWRGVVAGNAERWGRSLSAENYQEAFSDGTLQMIEGLLASDDFRAALKNTGGDQASSTAE